MSGMGFNTEKLRKKLKDREENGGGGRKKEDNSFLNYYKLAFGETITVRFLPANEDGDIFESWKSHGGNLKTRGIKKIRCSYDATGEACPVCSYAWDMYNDTGKEGDSKKWRDQEHFLAQVIVESSDIEIPPCDDGNLVKKMWMPMAIADKLTEDIVNGIVEDPTDRPFVIKKTRRNNTENADYGKSFFKGKDEDFPEHILDGIDNGSVRLLDLSAEMPEIVDAEALSEWLEDAQEKFYGTGEEKSAEPKSERTPRPKVEKPEQEPEQEEAPKRTSAKDAMARLKNRRNA